MSNSKFSSQDFNKMTFVEFDQSPNGWRKLADSGKFKDAAEAIVGYISSKSELNPIEMCLLRFHAAQMYARNGDKEIAREFVTMAGKDNNAAINVFGPAANAYMQATLAFIFKDRESLEKAFNEVRTTPMESYPKKSNTIFIPGRVHDMVQFFDKSYDDIFKMNPSLPPLPGENSWFTINEKDGSEVERKAENYRAQLEETQRENNPPTYNSPSPFNKTFKPQK